MHFCFVGIRSLFCLFCVVKNNLMCVTIYTRKNAALMRSYKI